MRFLRTLPACLAIAAILLLFIAPVLSGSLISSPPNHVNNHCDTVSYQSEVLYFSSSAKQDIATSSTADIPSLLNRLCGYCELVIHLPFMRLEWPLSFPDIHMVIMMLSARGEQVFYFAFPYIIHFARAPPSAPV